MPEDEQRKSKFPRDITEDNPVRTEIIRRKSGMPLKAASQGIPRKRTSIMGQPWEHDGGVIPEEAVTSALNAHN